MAKQNKKILITGANGFVGAELITQLSGLSGYKVIASVRKTSHAFSSAVQVSEGLDLSLTPNWTAALSQVNCVIHCAARVHVMNHADSPESLEQFRKINVEGTQNLARQAAASGVTRFVFVSSIKVNGEATTSSSPFSHTSQPSPMGAYAISKWEAEQKLWEIAQETGLEVVVVRPPLVYGPGVKANFLQLMQLVKWGIPLPFGCVDNRRSMIYVKNLADILIRCVCDQRAASQTFLVSDGRDLSTRDLVEQLAKAMRRKPRLLNIPPSLIQFCARMVHKKNFADRLFGSLQVDIDHTQSTLDWCPPFTIEEGMHATISPLIEPVLSTN